jgi:predicted metalloprotease with PDZ domain
MGANVWFSLGLRVGPDGTIADVRWGSAADKAKLAPGQKIVAINGRVESSDSLLAAVQAAKGATEPIHFIIQTESYVRNVDVDYHDGNRYPTLQRIEGTPAVLDDITKSLSPLTVLPKPERRGEGDDSDGGDRPARPRRPAATN